MNGTEYEDNLEVIVRDSLGCFTPLSADQIDTVSNASKYSISENDRDAELVSHEVPRSTNCSPPRSSHPPACTAAAVNTGTSRDPQHDAELVCLRLGSSAGTFHQVPVNIILF